LVKKGKEKTHKKRKNKKASFRQLQQHHTVFTSRSGETPHSDYKMNPLKKQQHNVQHIFI